MAGGPSALLLTTSVVVVGAAAAREGADPPSPRVSATEIIDCRACPMGVVGADRLVAAVGGDGDGGVKWLCLRLPAEAAGLRPPLPPPLPQDEGFPLPEFVVFIVASLGSGSHTRISTMSPTAKGSDECMEPAWEGASADVVELFSTFELLLLLFAAAAAVLARERDGCAVCDESVVEEMNRSGFRQSSVPSKVNES